MGVGFLERFSVFPSCTPNKGLFFFASEHLPCTCTWVVNTTPPNILSCHCERSFMGMRKNLHYLQTNKCLECNWGCGEKKTWVSSSELSLGNYKLSKREKKILMASKWSLLHWIQLSMQQLAGRLEEQENAIKLAWGDTLLPEWNSMSVDINSGVVKSQPETPLVGFHISLWSVTVADTPPWLQMWDACFQSFTLAA